MVSFSLLLSFCLSVLLSRHFLGTGSLFFLNFAMVLENVRDVGQNALGESDCRNFE